MKIKLYVDWENGKILKEEEYEKEIAKFAKDRENDDYDFEEFLDNYFERNLPNRNKLTHLFNLNKEEHKKILELWKENCFAEVRNNFLNDYEEVEIEV